MPKKAEMPSDVTPHRGLFDRFAEVMNKTVAQAAYFALCLVAVIAWAVAGPFTNFSDAWQMWINTGTTITTFLMVALLQNATRRSDQAIQHKLNAIAEGLADLMRRSSSKLKGDVKDLRAAVGLEDRESTTKNIKAGRSSVRGRGGQSP